MSSISNESVRVLLLHGWVRFGCFPFDMSMIFSLPPNLCLWETAFFLFLPFLFFSRFAILSFLPVETLSICVHPKENIHLLIRNRFFLHSVLVNSFRFVVWVEWVSLWVFWLPENLRWIQSKLLRNTDPLSTFPQYSIIIYNAIRSVYFPFNRFSFVRPNVWNILYIANVSC